MYICVYKRYQFSIISTIFHLLLEPFWRYGIFYFFYLLKKNSSHVSIFIMTSGSINIYFTFAL